MLQRILLGALGAGLAVGLITAALQQLVTTPLILQAEAYEGGGAEHHGGAHDRGAAEAAEPWARPEGIERMAYTSLATVLTGIGFSLVLLAAMVLKGGAIDGRSGLLWGLGGFAAVALAPALGLPPELPGSAAAELGQRQLWWAVTAVGTAVGLGLVVFGAGWPLRALGIAAVGLPHLIGAPHPHQFASTAPAELSGHFAAASLVVAAVFWALLGWASGTLYARLGREAPAAR
jgi:cobalt transporter subunit CbtA